MEMSYDGTLVMPKSYAVMDQEEMCYVEGGADIFINRTGVVAGIIDAALYSCPALAAVSKGLKGGKLLRNAVAAAKITKRKIINNAWSLAQKASRKITKGKIEFAVGFVWNLCGLSIGGIIATGLDYADGKANGLIYG